MSDTIALKRPGWPRPGASAAILRGDEVLLIERGKGTSRGLWSFPGGHIEPGERAAEAAAREVSEETGIAVAIEGLITVRDVLIRDRGGVLTAHYVLSVYWGRPLDPAQAPRAMSDAADARYVARSRLAGFVVTPGLIDDLDRARGLAGRV